MRYLVGTASWTDKTLIDCGRFYPPDCKTPEARLRYYASQFPLVEVDSSYYAVPAPATAQLWVERTPPDFVFNVKAFRLFTGHLTETKVLHKDLQPAMGLGRKFVYKEVPEEIRAELWKRFAEALEPLRLAGKLGLVHFQFPPRLKYSPEAMAHIERCMAWLPQHTLSIEFRHKSWWESPERVASTLAFLREHRLVHTIVDGPQGADNSVPAVWEGTHPDYLLLRLHGRNTDTYNIKGAASAAERFDYDYPDQELKELVYELVRLAYKARHAHIVFNNCDEDKGQRNGISFLKMLLAYG
ncbi:DUF72 domain-containing protein [Variovorax defluvii]|uniref:DUF72 domain-containing protein n=1 Tax=Variovorax defluvii TaxID=913761 RepID=A0ABP8HER7_9BURK